MDELWEQQLIEDYKYFDAKQYLEQYFTYDPSVCSLEEDEICCFELKSIHDFWNRFNGENLSLLEFGGGPCIYSLISACPHVEEIVFADFARSSRHEVELWQKNSPLAHDWSPYIKYVVEKLEGKAEQETVEREQKLRRKTRSIVPCDILQDHPLQCPDANMKVPPSCQFDVISTVSCIEAAVHNPRDLCKAVSKLAELQKPRGRLIMGVTLNGTYYYVGKTRLNSFPFTKEMVVKAVQQAGYRDLVVDSFTLNENMKKKWLVHHDHDKCIFISGRLGVI